MIANTATGRLTSTVAARCRAFARTLAKDSAYEGANQIDQLLRLATNDDAALKRLIGILADGLKTRMDAVDREAKP